MAETTVIEPPSDLDLQEAVDHLIAHYPPLMKDRHAIKFSIKDGAVTVSGHVQTPITRRYFLDNLRRLPGVTSVNDELFYDDETIRIDVGRVLPEGVRAAKVQYGGVILTGELSSDLNVSEVVAKVQAVPGVARVLTNF